MAWLLTVSPLLILLIGGLLLMVTDALVKERAELATLTAVILGVAGVVAMTLATGEPTAPVPGYVSAYLATDSMALFFDMVICLGAALSALLAGGYLAEHGDERGEFFVVLLFSALGAMILARATDLLSIFIGLETMSLGAYCLVGFRRTSPRSSEAAIKYFLLGSFAAAIFLFGSALLYGATGHTGLVAMGRAIAAGSPHLGLVVLGMALLLSSFAFKVSAVPFHMWAPDAYEGAPTPVTTFMAVAVKSAAFASLVRVLWGTFSDDLSLSPDTGWPALLAGLSAITMLYGNVAAVSQSSVKRMLAYSSIAHAGYILVAVVASFRVPDLGLSSAFFYLMAYTVSNVLAFGALILAGSKGKEVVSYEDLAGLGRRHPALALPFVIGVLSLMGFPPTVGFFAKYYVFSAAVSAGGGMVYLAILGVLTSAVGAYYYLRVIVFLFMREPKAGAPIADPMRSGYVVVAVTLAGAMVMLLGLFPSSLLEMATAAASSLATAP